MATGRLIARRYLLQRLIQQGAACAVYQGFDQVLQRAVAVKIAPAEQIPVYRAALRGTSQFSHPNIVGIYDMIVEPDALYIVQEYVDGDDFGTLLQSQLSPSAVVDFGVQLCQALIYAGTPSRKICHGDLTPATVIRDRRGSVRVNNFALPSDLHYFTAWNVVGGNTTALSDSELPYGQASIGRKSDDSRAVGLLLYQLLAGRNADARSVEPPLDGRLRFLRNVPPELCEVIARAIIRTHPQHIATAETLLAELKPIAGALEPPPPVAAPEMAYAGAMDEQRAFAPSPVAALAGHEMATDDVMMPQRATSAPLMAPAMQAASAVVPDISMQLAQARQAAYGNLPGSTRAQNAASSRLNVPLLLLIGLVLFGLFFGVGYWLALHFIH
jgi:serine/threonine protein kinase